MTYILTIILVFASAAAGSAGEPVKFDPHQLVGETIPMDQRPEYPFEARRSGLTGSGVFILNIDAKTGRVTSVTAEKSTGNRMLDAACRNAVVNWQFKPHTVTRVRFPITFTMRR